MSTTRILTAALLGLAVAAPRLDAQGSHLGSISWACSRGAATARPRSAAVRMRVVFMVALLIRSGRRGRR